MGARFASVLAAPHTPSPPFDTLKAMGDFPTRKHSDELIAAIVTASNTGLNNSQIQKQLEAGRLASWPNGPYEIPYATVSYYVRIAKRAALAGAHELSDRAKGDMHAALDGMGREIATELFIKLEHERKKKSPDIDKLAKIAAVAKAVKPLIKDTPAKQPVPAVRADPFGAKLKKAAKKPAAVQAEEPREPVPTALPWAKTGDAP